MLSTYYADDSYEIKDTFGHERLYIELVHYISFVNKARCTHQSHERVYIPTEN